MSIILRSFIHHWLPSEDTLNNFNYFRENYDQSLISLGPKLDSLLLDQPYISGWNPSLLDFQILKDLEQPDTSLPNLLRWFNHIKSFSKQGTLSELNKNKNK